MKILQFDKMLLVLCVAGLGWSGALAKSIDGTATVMLSKPSGVPKHLASGMIYGIPAKKDQIPAEFFDGMGFTRNLAGAAQTPTRGWIGGLDAFNARFQASFEEYSTTREHRGDFQLRVSDLWGADGGETTEDPFPGDDGDWTSYDMFIDAIINGIKKNHMSPGLSVEVWNEPDGTFFWKRSQAQYFDMWSRGIRRLRSGLGKEVLMIGPSFQDPPGELNSWWDAFLTFIRQNGSTPDIYVWHSLQFDPTNFFGDPQEAAAELTSLLKNHSLAIKPFIINEYGAPNEQQPGGTAWFISRLERLNIPGLRANWQGGSGEFHDYLANLLGKPGAGTPAYQTTGEGYWPNGEWQVYHYYAKQMKGERVATTGSADRLFDVYATSERSGSGVKILGGPRLALGTWAIQVEGLAHIGHSPTGNVGVRTLRFDFNGTFGLVGGPLDMGVTEYEIHNDSVSWVVTPPTNGTAYAWELVDYP